MNKRGAPQKYGEKIIPIAVRLPKSLVQSIDRVVMTTGAQSRSAFIVQALRDAVEPTEKSNEG